MRTAPAAQITASEGAAYSVHFRVRVKNGSGTWKDFSSLSGFNWIDSLEWGEDIDDPVATATIRLWREDQLGTLSLAPFDEASTINRLDDGTTYSPALDLSREVQIEVATLASTAQLATEWVPLFHGYIDDIEWPNTESRVTLQCRDLGAKLVDTFIETKRNYGSEAGVAVETVMQSILTDNSTGVTLYVPSSPGFLIKPYVQDRVSVMEALRTLADLMGWVVRYRWDAGTSAFRLTLMEPDRAKTVPDKTLGPSFWFDPKQLSISIAGIRNAWRVVYTDSADGLEKNVTADNATSITKYGRRYAEIQEASDSPIDTSVEATTFVEAARDDTSEPKATMAIESLFWWPAELYDLIRYSANGTHFSVDQDLAVSGLRHRLSLNQHRSTVNVRGKPAGAYTRWLEREQRGTPRGPLRANVPPIFQPRATLSTNRDTADLAGVVVSRTGEDVRLHFRDDETTASPATWSLVAGSADSTPKWVTSGSDIGPTEWFHNGSTFAQKLNDIPLTRDQVKRVFFQTEGRQTALRSDWKPFEINIKESPYAAIAVSWDEVNDKLKAVVTGGPNIASAIVEFDEDPAFGSIHSTHTISVGTGARAVQDSTVLAAADRDRQWYARVRPFNGASGTGLEGDPEVASTRVEGNQPKEFSIPGNAFMPGNTTLEADYFRTTSGGIENITQDVDLVFYAWVPVPRGLGVRLDGISIRAVAGGAAFQVYFVKVELVRNNLGGSSTVLATITHGPTTPIEAETSIVSLSETTTGNNYLLKLTLHGAPTGLGSASALVWVRILYTSPELIATV